MASKLDRWNGGRLRLYMPTPPIPDPEGRRIDRIPITTGDPPVIVEHDYIALGGGWAIRADLPLAVAIEEPGLHGISAFLDMRDGRFSCVGVISGDHGPPLTTQVQRRTGPLTAKLAEAYWPEVVARLVEHEGDVVAEKPIHRPTSERPVSGWNIPSDDVLQEYERRHGRPGRPRDDERLMEVARLYQEAKRIGRPTSRHIAEHLPGYAQATYRSWVRKARVRGFLEPLGRGENDG
jgi:hypothetical protein